MFIFYIYLYLFCICIYFDVTFYNFLDISHLMIYDMYWVVSHFCRVMTQCSLEHLYLLTCTLKNQFSTLFLYYNIYTYIIPANLPVTYFSHMTATAS